MNGRRELPDMPLHPIEQLVAECQAALRRLLILASIFLVSMLGGWLLALALAAERAP